MQKLRCANSFENACAVYNLKASCVWLCRTWGRTCEPTAGHGRCSPTCDHSIASPTGDPVQSIFNATTMPGVQNADLANAIALYALLTGLVSQVQTAAYSWKFYGLPKGTPGQACRGGSN